MVLVHAPPADTVAVGARVGGTGHPEIQMMPADLEGELPVGIRHGGGLDGYPQKTAVQRRGELPPFVIRRTDFRPDNRLARFGVHHPP